MSCFVNVVVFCDVIKDQLAPFELPPRLRREKARPVCSFHQKRCSPPRLAPVADSSLPPPVVLEDPMQLRRARLMPEERQCCLKDASTVPNVVTSCHRGTGEPNHCYQQSFSTPCSSPAHHPSSDSQSPGVGGLWSQELHGLEIGQETWSKAAILNRGGTATQGVFRELWGALEAIFLKGWHEHEVFLEGICLSLKQNWVKDA